WIPGSQNTIADILSRRRHIEEKGTQINVIDDDQEFTDQVRSLTPLDPDLLEIINDLQTTKFPSTCLKRFSYAHGLLWYQEQCLVIPKPLRLNLLYANHDTPVAGHPSWVISYDLLSRHYYWPRMSRDTRKYVQSCDLCQRNKDLNRHPYGLLQP